MKKLRILWKCDWTCWGLILITKSTETQGQIGYMFRASVYSARISVTSAPTYVLERVHLSEPKTTQVCALFDVCCEKYVRIVGSGLVIIQRPEQRQARLQTCYNLEDGARSAPTLSSVTYPPSRAGSSCPSIQSLGGQDQHEKIESTSPIKFSV